MIFEKPSELHKYIFPKSSRSFPWNCVKTLSLKDVDTEKELPSELALLVMWVLDILNKTLLLHLPQKEPPRGAAASLGHQRYLRKTSLEWVFLQILRRLLTHCSSKEHLLIAASDIWREIQSVRSPSKIFICCCEQ